MFSLAKMSFKARLLAGMTLVFMALMLMPEYLMAQTADDFLQIENALLPFLIIVGGYLSPKIPFFNKIDSNTFRVLAWAVAVGILTVAFGFASTWDVAISYFFSTSLYEVVLRWIFGRTGGENDEGS